jgi:hypothetical protein
VSNEGVVLANFFENVVAVIKVIRQCGVDLPKGQMRQRRDNLVGGLSRSLGHKVHVLHTNAGSSDERTRLAIAIRADFDVFRFRLSHASIVTRQKLVTIYAKVLTTS